MKAEKKQIEGVVTEQEHDLGDMMQDLNKLRDGTERMKMELDKTEAELKNKIDDLGAIESLEE